MTAMLAQSGPGPKRLSAALALANGTGRNLFYRCTELVTRSFHRRLVNDRVDFSPSALGLDHVAAV